MGRNKVVNEVLYSLIGIFVLLVCFFLPYDDNLRSTLFPVAGVLALVFLVLGIVLVVLAIKKKVKGKVYLVMAGSAASLFLVSVILHNLFYALTVLTEDVIILPYLFEGLHVVFFLIGIPICPILFIVGVVLFIVTKSYKTP